MSVAWQLFSELGFEGLSFQLNSTGCPDCRPGYIRKLVAYYEAHRGEVCEDCRRRLERNPLRLLDCKVESCQPIIAGAPQILDDLCSECAEHFGSLHGYLDGLGRAYAINHRLVRGLDYYTKTVFEVWAQGIGAQNAVCGGGRYDGLAQELEGEPTPGIGFGSGLERIVMLMKQQGVPVPGVPGPQVVLAYHGQPAKIRCLGLLTELREQGVRATMGFDDRSLKAQLRNANRLGATYALVLGDQELAADRIMLQDMVGDAPRETIELVRVLDELRTRLGVEAACNASA